MDPATSTCHVASISYPGRSHIKPMFGFYHLLTSRRDDVLITFVLTQEWQDFIGTDPKPSNLPVMTKMDDPCERLLDLLKPLVTVIVTDTFCSGRWNGQSEEYSGRIFMADVGFEFYHLDNLIVQAQNSPTDMSEHSDLKENKQIFGQVKEAFSWIRKAQFLCHRCFKGKILIPHLFSWTLIPYFKLGHSSIPLPSYQSNNSGCLEWLDSQRLSSVLYISLGSFLSVSSAQMDEIAVGLQQSGVRFLWVVRGEAARIKDICGEMGMVVAWCDQLRVLSHDSVGGFWSHCGWNSVVEGVFSGLPFLTFPIVMDQHCNGKLIVEDWKIGWRVRRELGKEVLVKRDEIACLVKKFMDLESNEGNEMRRRARELQEICQQAITKGESSYSNLEAFARDIHNAATVEAG
ncbi:hypothetical protein AAG906_005811 [Vitis piasezkii]